MNVITSPRVEVADYRDFMRSFPQGSVDLILTDPPYTISKYTGFTRGGIKKLGVLTDFGEWDYVQLDLTEMLQSLYSALRNGGTAIIWYDVWKIGMLKEKMETAGFKMIRLIIWQKINPVPLNMKKHIYLIAVKWL